jgi:MFS family permease
MGTFDMQIKDLQIVTDINEEHNFARVFTIITASGIIFIPIVGILMDTTGFPVSAVVITLSGVLWSICLVVSTSYSLLLSFFFYSFYRTSFFIFIFGYLADTFGFKYYGLLAGIMFLCGGFMGLLQYPLATYALGTCHHQYHHLIVVTDNNKGSNDSMEDDCDQGQWYQVHIVMMIMILSTLYFSYQDQVRRIIIAEHIKSMEMIRNRIRANKAINTRADKSSQWK